MARKRAAIDIFLKTEMDRNLVEAYEDYQEAVRVLKTSPPLEQFCTEEASKKHYLAIRRFLNIHELIAVGIANGMFNDHVCYDFWGEILMACVDDTKPLIKHIREQVPGRTTYLQLERLAEQWTRQSENRRNSTKSLGGSTISRSLVS